MNNKNKVEILVVGAGAVGAYFCGRLARHGASVSVVVRSDYEIVRKQGFVIKSIDGDFSYMPQGVFREVAEYRGEADYLVVALKALPEIQTARIIAPAVAEKTTIVMIQNGVNIEDEIAAAFPDNPLLSAVAYIGVSRQSPGHILHQGAGWLRLGIYPHGGGAALDRLAAMFAAAGVKVEKVGDIVRTRWEKLVWNAPFNPISILAGGVNTKQIMDDPLLSGLAEKIMREVCLTAAACGHPLPADVVEKNLAYTRKFPPYKTSMLLDHENKRNLEVEVIIGNIIHAAHNKNVPVPCLEIIYALLQSVDKHGGQ